MKAILLVTVVLFLQACGTTVKSGERGVRGNLLTGRVTAEPLKSGFYWRAPWNQIDVYNVQWRRYTETVEALSSDGLPVIIKTVILMRPTPGELSILAQNVGPDFYPRVVKPELLRAVRSAVSGYPMVIVLEHSSEIASKVEAVVADKLKGRHLQVASIAMVDVELATVVQDAVEPHQAKEQEIIAKTLTQEHLPFKLYDSSDATFVLLPDMRTIPVRINTGADQPSRLPHEEPFTGTDTRSGR